MTPETAGDRDRERAYWIEWQQSWDRQQERSLPDREERLAVLVGLVGSVAGDSPPRVLDLACGCGSITRRILCNFPDATVVGADIDPVLLRIAEGAFDQDQRVRLQEVDLRTVDWAARFPHQGFDAVVTATALHWLDQGRLARVYRAIVGLLRPGGLFANADHFPLRTTPGLDQAARDLSLTPDRTGEAWEEWWERVAQTSRLTPLLEVRSRRFGGTLHPAEFTPPAEWHLEQLTQAGFTECQVVWRQGQGAVVAALR